MDPTIKKILEDKICKTGGGRRMKKKKHTPLKKGFLLNKKNGLGDEFRKKQKQEKLKEACGIETNISNLLDPEEVLTEEDLIDTSKMDIDINKNCTDECIDDIDCDHKREQRIEGRKKIMQAEYHNAKVKIQNRMYKTKKEERRLKNIIKMYHENKKQMSNNVESEIKNEMKKRGITSQNVTKENINELVKQICQENGFT